MVKKISILILSCLIAVLGVAQNRKVIVVENNIGSSILEKDLKVDINNAFGFWQKRDSAGYWTAISGGIMYNSNRVNIGNVLTRYSKLNVQGGVSADTLVLGGVFDSRIYSNYYDLNFWTYGVKRMNIDASGRVYIGTMPSSYPYSAALNLGIESPMLVVNGVNPSLILNGSSGTSNAGIRFNGDGGIGFAEIASNGSIVSIGTGSTLSVLLKDNYASTPISFSRFAANGHSGKMSTGSYNVGFGSVYENSLNYTTGTCKKVLTNQYLGGLVFAASTDDTYTTGTSPNAVNFGGLFMQYLGSNSANSFYGTNNENYADFVFVRHANKTGNSIYSNREVLRLKDNGDIKLTGHLLSDSARLKFNNKNIITEAEYRREIFFAQPNGTTSYFFGNSIALGTYQNPTANLRLDSTFRKWTNQTGVTNFGVDNTNVGGFPTGSVPTYSSNTMGYIVVKYGENEIGYVSSNIDTASYKTLITNAINHCISKGWTVDRIIVPSPHFITAGGFNIYIGAGQSAVSLNDTRTQSYVKAHKNAVNALGAVYVNCYDILKNDTTLLADGLHLNAKGSEVMGRHYAAAVRGMAGYALTTNGDPMLVNITTREGTKPYELSVNEVKRVSKINLNTNGWFTVAQCGDKGYFDAVMMSYGHQTTHIEGNYMYGNGSITVLSNEYYNVGNPTFDSVRIKDNQLQIKLINMSNSHFDMWMTEKKQFSGGWSVVDLVADSGTGTVLSPTRLNNQSGMSVNGDPVLLKSQAGNFATNTTSTASNISLPFKGAQHYIRIDMSGTTTNVAVNLTGASLQAGAIYTFGFFNKPTQTLSWSSEFKNVDGTALQGLGTSTVAATIRFACDGTNLYQF